MVELTAAVKRATPVKPAISVIICAYSEERWDTLLAACGAVREQLTDDDELVVVIDHNEELLARAKRILVDLLGARVLESAAKGNGVSGARNTGVSASRCDVIAFLDDDAEPEAGWLEQLRSAFRDDSTLVVGTGIEPRWAGGRAPRWFPPEFGWVVGCGYTGLPTSRAQVRNPIAASMAVHRRAFEAAGNFSEALGRIGKLPVGCEETEFCIRLARAVPTATVLHEPRSVVYQVVPDYRQTVRYFVWRCYHEGRSKHGVARMGGVKAGLSAERSYVRRILPAAVMRDLVRGARRLDPYSYAQAAMVVLGLLSTATGFVCESVRPARRRRGGLRWSS